MSSFNRIDKCANELELLIPKLHEGIDKTCGHIDDIARFLTSEPTNVDENVEQAEKIVKDYLTMSYQLKMYVEAVQEMKVDITQTENTDYERLFNEKVNQMTEKYRNSRVEDEDAYKEFVRRVEEMKSFQSSQATATNEEELCVELNVNTMDPITRTQMTDPVRSKVCKHAFEREAIMNLLRRIVPGRMAGRIKCPVPACNSYVTEKDLETYTQLKNYIDKNAKH